MPIKAARDLFLEQLRNLSHAERQPVRARPRLARAASSCVQRSRTLALVAALLAPLALAACEEQGPIERTGEQVGEGLERAGEGIEEGAEELQDRAD